MVENMGIERKNPRNVIDLDKKDRRIIKLLQENGRRTNADISRSIGMSESTVKNRIDRLIEHRILRVLAVLNPETVGYGADVMIGIRVLAGQSEKVGERLQVLNEVVYVAYITGRYDIIIEVLLRKPEDLFQYISKDIGSIPGISSTETFYILHTRKINYEWKLPADLYEE